MSLYGGGVHQLNNRCIYLPINLQLFADSTLNYTKVDNPYEHILVKPTYIKGDIKTKIIYNLIEYYKKIPNYETIASLPEENIEYIKEGLPNVTSCYRMLDSCKALTSIDTTGWDTSNIENMNSMFHNCEKLATLDVSKFNTSKVTDMSHMFDLSDSRWFEEYELTTLDVSNWDTSNVTDMSYMFRNCKGLANLDVSKWNTSKVTDMSGMFAYCHQLPEETMLDVFNKWNTSNVTNMEDMFYSGPRCLSTSPSLLSNLSNWDTSKVTNMNGMFGYWTLSGTVDLSNLNTSNVTNMGSMFYYCTSLTTLDLSNWDTSNVTNMAGMFKKCESLKTLDISNWDTSNVTDMSGMFYLTEDNDDPEFGAPLKTIKGVIDMKSCTSYDQMFWGCTNLTSPVKIKNPPVGFTPDLEEDKYEIVS